jgi:uncharacterized protein
MLLKDVKKILNVHKNDLFEYGVYSLAVFGSIARGEGSVKSDIDILVDFDSKKGLFAFVGLKDYLEKILKCEVDLVTKNALHPALKQKILLEARHVL